MLALRYQGLYFVAFTDVGCLMILSKSIEHMKLQMQPSDFVYGIKPQLSIEGPVDVYVHVPFCMTTCEHCVFYKTLFKQVKKNAYLQALLLEILNAQDLQGIKTLTIGGGTPNLLTPAELKKVIDAFRVKTSIEEIHMEALPSLLTEAYVRELKAIGITTLILGLERYPNGDSGQCGRLTETLPHLLKVVNWAKGLELKIRVGILTGITDQRETSFVEDVHLIAEMKPEEIRIRPLIKGDQEPNERTFELIEIAAEILMAQGYLRNGLWQFGLEESNQKEFSNVMGFGPSAYTLYDQWLMINPELDLYMHEQIYGQQRAINSELNESSIQWRLFIQELFALNITTGESNFPFGKWYKRWLQISGSMKHGTLNEKGLMDAHALVYARIAMFPRPIQNPELIQNSAYYLAESTFAQNYEYQFEQTRRQNESFEMRSHREKNK